MMYLCGMNCESIVLVGAGRLATCLGRALHEAGLPIRQVYSRTEASARALADALGCEATTDIDRILTDEQIAAEGACDARPTCLYITALTDNALLELIPRLTCGRTAGLWVHTAGSVPMDVWQRGGVESYGVVYPMQTFSRERRVDFSRIPIFIEGCTPEVTDCLRAFAGRLSTRVVEANTEQRRSLHLAAVFTCNFANHVYDLADRLLQRCGLPFDVMLPLIDETAAKVHTLSPRQAQTGPAVRYDTAVIDAHLQMLADDPQTQAIYRLLTDSIHRASQMDLSCAR